MQAERVRAVRVAANVDDLLAGAVQLGPLSTADSKSGSRMERVAMDGERRVVKYLDVEESWLMRATGDTGSRQLRLFGSHILDRLPDCIDHAVEGIAPTAAFAGRTGTALLMDDVGDWLVPEGGGPVDAHVELRIIDAMAALHAAYRGFPGDDCLMSLATHYLFLGEAVAAVEAERGSGEPVPWLIAEGWLRLGLLDGRVARTVRTLLDDPSALVLALETTPQTLVHGDWKLGNIGVRPDGRTILLDWDRVSRAPATLDLAWYLAVNCDRLARSKDELIDVYRERLESHGVDTADWFDGQLALTLTGAFVQLGWNKLGGDPVELDWWERRILVAAPLLGS